MNSFFIAGEQRSGTTLLSVVLSRHSKIYIDGFSIGFRLVSCFKHLARVLPYNAKHDLSTIQSWLIENDYKGRLAAFLDHENLDRFPNAQEVIQDGINKRLAENDKLIFGDKSPGIHHFIPELKALVPKARIIHVVRDARAVAYSQYSRTGKNVSLGAQDWVDGNAKGLTNQLWIGDETYMILKYEDLVLAPEKTIKSVCRFLEIDFEKAMVMDAPASSDDDYVLPSFEKVKIDAYQQKLSANQLFKIERIAAPLMNRFGYKPITDAERIPHKQLSEGKRIWLNQWDNIKLLFVSSRKGMHNRKNIDLEIPLKVRVKNLIFHLGRDLLSDRAFKRLFRKRWIKEVYMDK